MTSPPTSQRRKSRGVRLCGRELDSPDTAVTVRVRDGGTLVIDGPFAETREFAGGFDVLDCSDLDEAVEVEAKCPVTRYLLSRLEESRDPMLKR